MDRPGSVTAVAIIQLVFGVIGALFSLLGILGGALFGSALSNVSEHAEDPQAAAAFAAIGGGVILVLSVIGLLTSALSILFSIGLLQLKTWGWIGSLIIQGIGLLSNLAQVVGGNFLSAIGLIVGGVIIFILLQPTAKRAFEM